MTTKVAVQMENLKLPEFLSPPTIKQIDENCLLYCFEHEEVILVNELSLKDSTKIPGFKEFAKTKVYIVKKQLRNGIYSFYCDGDKNGEKIEADDLAALIALIYV